MKPENPHVERPQEYMEILAACRPHTQDYSLDNLLPFLQVTSGVKTSMKEVPADERRTRYYRHC